MKHRKKMDVPFHRPSISEDEVEAVAESIRSGWITMGPVTADFEEQFASFVGMPYAIAVNSGTAALHCALDVLGLGEGDEVIVPANTFIATAEVVEYFRARPVLVDIEKDSHNISHEKILEAIGPRTRAIIPVHFAGQPCDMDEIMNIAQENNLAVIDDAAHSLPSKYKGKMIGSISDMSCFSFYATKPLTTGEGGMIVTADKDRAEELKSLRLHGMARDAWKRYQKSGSWKYDVLRMGYKYNTTDMNAAMGIVQLKKQNRMYDARVEIARSYAAAFSGTESLIPYQVKEDRESSWHLYPLKIRPDALTIDRDRFIEELAILGVGTSVHFIPLYRFTCYQDIQYRVEDFSASEWVYEREISLPIYPDMTDTEIEYVIQSVLDIASKNKK